MMLKTQMKQNTGLGKIKTMKDTGFGTKMHEIDNPGLIYFHAPNILMKDKSILQFTLILSIRVHPTAEDGIVLLENEG